MGRGKLFKTSLRYGWFLKRLFAFLVDFCRNPRATSLRLAERHDFIDLATRDLGKLLGGAVEEESSPWWDLDLIRFDLIWFDPKLRPKGDIV